MNYILILSPLLIFITSNICLACGMYADYPMIDVPFHLIGGMSIVLATVGLNNLLRENHKILTTSLLINFLIIFGIVTCAAVTWEYAQYITNQLINDGHQNTLADTLSDILYGQIGGTIAFLIIKTLQKKN